METTTAKQIQTSYSVPAPVVAACDQLLRALRSHYGQDFSFVVAGNGKTLAASTVNAVVMPSAIAKQS